MSKPDKSTQRSDLTKITSAFLQGPTNVLGKASVTALNAQTLAGVDLLENASGDIFLVRDGVTLARISHVNIKIATY